VFLASIKDPSIRRELQQLEKEFFRLRDEMARVIKDGQIILDHAKQTNLDYASSGHTGFASATNLATKVAKAGDTMSGTLAFPNDVKATFGTGTIMFDAGNNYLTEDTLAIVSSTVAAPNQRTLLYGETIVDTANGNNAAALTVRHGAAHTKNLLEFKNSSGTVLPVTVDLDGKLRSSAEVYLTSGTYLNPLRIGNHRVWSNGTNLYGKLGAPSSTTDGTIIV